MPIDTEIAYNCNIAVASRDGITSIQINLVLHGSRPLSDICHLLGRPLFSFYTNFKTLNSLFHEAGTWYYQDPGHKCPPQQHA